MKASNYKAVVESSRDLRRPSVPLSSLCRDAYARRLRAGANSCAFSSQVLSALSTRAEEKTIFADLDGRSKGPDVAQQRRLSGRKTAAHRRAVLRRKDRGVFRLEDMHSDKCRSDPRSRRSLRVRPRVEDARRCGGRPGWRALPHS